MWVSVLKCLNQFLSLNFPRARRIKRLWIYFSNLEKTENNTQVIHFNEQGKGYKRLKTILKTCIYRNIFLSCLCINMFESRVHGLQKWFKQQWELLKLASVLHWAFKRCIRRQQRKWWRNGSQPGGRWPTEESQPEFFMSLNCFYFPALMERIFFTVLC